MMNWFMMLSFFQTKQPVKGQGVIEYAGALVIAAVLVAAVLAVGPDGMTTLFTSIIESVQGYFTGQLPGGGGGA